MDWDLFAGITAQEWKELYDLAKIHGIVAVVFEIIKNIPKEFSPPRPLIMSWYAHALKIERQMQEREKVSQDLARIMSDNGIGVTVLKGMAFAEYYPNPYHRESGDLDCYLMGNKDEGDKVLVEAGADIKDAGYKHSNLYWKGLVIENHKFITSFDNTARGIRTEKLLQQMIKEATRPIGNSKLLNPGAAFNAIFLVKHAQRHFFKEGICIRHLLDWAFFLRTERYNLQWNEILSLMDECGILNFAKVMTTLCEINLGMAYGIEGLEYDSSLVWEVNEDIMNGLSEMSNETLYSKAIRISRRFLRMWKYRELSDESYMRMLWNSFAFSSYLHRKPQI